RGRRIPILPDRTRARRDRRALGVRCGALAARGRGLGTARRRAFVVRLPAHPRAVRGRSRGHGSLLGRATRAVDRRQVGPAPRDRVAKQRTWHDACVPAARKEVPRMLWTVILILLILWLLGGPILNLGALIHLLLVIALIVLLVQLISGRRVAL